MSTDLGGYDEFGMPVADPAKAADQSEYDEFGMPTSDPNAPAFDDIGSDDSDYAFPDTGGSMGGDYSSDMGGE